MADIERLGPEALPHFPKRLCDFATMRLRANAAARHGCATLIVAPYAAHDARIADFAPGHSLAQTLIDAGAGALALTAWKSATPAMRDFGIDAYLADLDAAVEALGGRARLVGLCQGGWLGALYAARFPGKVERLALIGAPVAPRAAPSQITQALAWTPPALLAGAVALAGGRVWGLPPAILSSLSLDRENDVAYVLQCAPDQALRERFAAWLDCRFDLPGRFFLETAEWLFRENRLAEGRFPALGRRRGLADIVCPIYALAGAADLVAPPPQVTAVREMCPRAAVVVEVAAGGHLSLFLGRRTLARNWPRLAHWLIGPRAARRRSA